MIGHEVSVGDWVRYTEGFCSKTSTTDMGLRDMLSRRGRVESVFPESDIFIVDWGDYCTQHSFPDRLLTASEDPSLATAAAPQPLSDSASSDFAPRDREPRDRESRGPEPM